jgi:general secretion pathway protein A
MDQLAGAADREVEAAAPVSRSQVLAEVHVRWEFERAEAEKRVELVRAEAAQCEPDRLANPSLTEALEQAAGQADGSRACTEAQLEAARAAQTQLCEEAHAQIEAMRVESERAMAARVGVTADVQADLEETRTEVERAHADGDRVQETAQARQETARGEFESTVALGRVGRREQKRDAVGAHRDDTDLAFGSGAEFRSRLAWFIGASDASPQDPGSLTYERYFGLREKPFSLSSDPRFFFSNSTHGATFDRLAAGIRRREGILVLTGEVGTGKTTLCRAVFQSLDQKTFAAFVPDPFLSREDLLKTLLVSFGVVSADEIRSGRLRGVSRTDLSYPLYDFLASLQPLKAFAVVMIDEAQNLTTELLEEIRILSDLENRQKLIQVLLVGQPELQSRLATSAMRQVSQRVSVRCELIPLAREDVRPYVSRRLTVAGHDGRVQFTDAAIDLVGTASNGTPRVINLVCDRALFRAAHSQSCTVDSEHVVWALDDLKLAVARTLGASFGDQSGGGLESFDEEFLEPEHDPTHQSPRFHVFPLISGRARAGHQPSPACRLI